MPYKFISIIRQKLLPADKEDDINKQPLAAIAASGGYRRYCLQAPLNIERCVLGIGFSVSTVEVFISVQVLKSQLVLGKEDSTAWVEISHTQL